MRATTCLVALTTLLGVATLAMAKGAPPPTDGGREVELASPRPASGNPFTMPRWSPYVAGAGIGVLCCLAFLLSDKTVGCSTAFARTAGMLERLVRGKAVEAKPYYQQFKPVVDWEWMLVAGLLLGAAASALLSDTFRPHWVPPLWAATAGTNPVVRWVVAFFGGILMGFGARWAGGCTSGHGISGTLQLAASGWLAVAGFFIGGIATAVVLFHIILA